MEILEHKNKLYCSYECCNKYRSKQSEIKKQKELDKPAQFGKIKLKDITLRELKEIRDNAKFCQICGKSVEEVKNENNHFKHLCVDHDHITNKFRGMLCMTCNRNLGWYEHYKIQINEYLQK